MRRHTGTVESNCATGHGLEKKLSSTQQQPFGLLLLRGRCWGCRIRIVARASDAHSARKTRANGSARGRGNPWSRREKNRRRGFFFRREDRASDPARDRPLDPASPSRAARIGSEAAWIASAPRVLAPPCRPSRTRARASLIDMDGQRTPPRDDAEAEPDVPLRERMERLQDELLDARELLERVAPGAPRVHAPVTVTEAFEMMDAAQAAKAKENVRPSTPARHLEARRAAVPRARRSEPASPRSNNRRPGRRSFLYSPFRRLNRRVASAPDREAHPAPPYPPPAEIQKGQSGRREDEGEGHARLVAIRGSVLPETARVGSRARPPHAPVGRRPRPSRAPTRSITHGTVRGWTSRPETSGTLRGDRGDRDRTDRGDDDGGDGGGDKRRGDHERRGVDVRDRRFGNGRRRRRFFTSGRVHASSAARGAGGVRASPRADRRPSLGRLGG